jgi:hypothetical protein
MVCLSKTVDYETRFSCPLLYCKLCYLGQLRCDSWHSEFCDWNEYPRKGSILFHLLDITQLKQPWSSFIFS